MRIAVALLLVVAASLSWGQNLPDPTRPPDSLTDDPESTGGPMLQSTLVSPTRREAVISGQTVRVGDKFRNAQVVAINEGEVVLREGKDRQVLHFPGVEGRTPVVTETKQPAAKKGRQQK